MIIFKNETFRDLRTFCKKKKYPFTILKKRLNDGWTIEEAVFFPFDEELDPKYRTPSEMCKEHNISEISFFEKLKAGCSLEAALKEDKEDGTIFKDHVGNRFPSMEKMFEYYNIDSSTAQKRLDNGCTLEDTLTIKENTVNIEDHLGNKYESIKEMCDAYKIKSQTFMTRIDFGWSIKEALTIPVLEEISKKHLESEDPDNISVQKKKSFKYKTTITDLDNMFKSNNCSDHLGIHYTDYKEMLEHYRLDETIAYNRYKKKWSLEKILTTPIRRNEMPVRDYKGNRFCSYEDMFDYYGIDKKDGLNKIRKGWTTERIIKENIKEKSLPAIIADTCTDHLGNKFKSYRAMFDYYNIPTTAGYKRLQAGWNIKDILLTPAKNQIFKSDTVYYDHLGNKYDNLKEMFKFYKIPFSTGRRRLYDGWTIKEALTTPIVINKQNNHKQPCHDHLGNEFESITEMLKHYKLSLSIYYNRKNAGWDLEKTLTEPIHYNNKVCYDHKGNRFESINEMCAYYKIHTSVYLDRIKKGWTVERALTEDKIDSRKACVDHLGNKFESLNAMFAYYNISPRLGRSRLRSGWSLEKTLTTPAKGNN